ncbi:MAG: hypothetical protein AVDCRST_MAG01-01-3318 [uncultured Rubrobacteraceae bacterium]|uniref:Uncharacterized protein n=1 Tax=uncultured Rubrobacteraceae bacterium TaxID=349277 RepID=A0A6J4Q746_9ACTN|nr:MAG: hypothetical protein AVDCRST_MAG01-01-3318 [uncultured Rubrobacteraceae bacterium]
MAENTPNLDRPDPRRSHPPEEGYTLYRHRNAEETRTGGWHGYYWARRTTGGEYEIRSVPTSLGEPSVFGGVVPTEPFERLYRRADRV